MEDYMDLTIAISDCGVSWMGKYMASLVQSTDLDQLDEMILSKLTGYGDTPLEAAANLLDLAAVERRRREP